MLSRHQKSGIALCCTDPVEILLRYGFLTHSNNENNKMGSVLLLDDSGPLSPVNGISEKASSVGDSLHYKDYSGWCKMWKDNKRQGMTAGQDLAGTNDGDDREDWRTDGVTLSIYICNTTQFLQAKWRICPPGFPQKPTWSRVAQIWTSNNLKKVIPTIVFQKPSRGVSKSSTAEEPGSGWMNTMIVGWRRTM